MALEGFLLEGREIGWEDAKVASVCSGVAGGMLDQRYSARGA